MQRKSAIIALKALLFAALLAMSQIAVSPLQDSALAKEPSIDWSSSPVAASPSAVFYNNVPSGIVKLNAKTGQQLWAFSPTKGWIVSNVVTLRSRVYVTGNALSPCGPIYALNSDSGKVVWSRKYSSCRIWSDGQRLYLQGNSGDGVRALDPVTGDLLWSADDETPHFIDTLVAMSGRVYTNDRVLNSKTGKTVLWWPHDSDVTTLLASHGTIFMGTENGAVVAYDARTLKRKWHSSVLAGKNVESMVAVGKLIFAVAYTGEAKSARNGLLQAYDAGTGKKKWSLRIASCCRSLDAAPLGAAPGLLMVILPTDKKSGSDLVAFDPATRGILWSFKSSITLQGPPIAQGKHVYVVDAQDDLIALNASTGKQVWMHKP